MLELSFLKKAKAKLDAASNVFELDDPIWAGKYPYLALHMWANQDEDGEARQRCQVKVVVESGCWKACLVDLQCQRSLWVTLKAPEDCWKVLEKALAAPDPEWRVWPQERDGKAGKKPWPKR